MLDMAFIELHYAGRETWYVNVASISAVREISGESDPSDNGVWIYLKGDSQALKVSETVDEVFALINGVTDRFIDGAELDLENAPVEETFDS